MSSEKTTASGRVPQETFERVTDRLEEDEVEDPTTNLIRTAYLLYENDPDYRDFMRRNMKGEEIGLGDYATVVLSRYGYDIPDNDRDDALEGILDLISGVQNNHMGQAIRGGEKLVGIDSELSEAAVDYVARNIDRSYWKD